VRGGQVNVSAAMLGSEAMGAPLPDIHLTDIGKATEALGKTGAGATDSVKDGVGKAGESIKGLFGK
jgi:hypothetical protein